MKTLVTISLLLVAVMSTAQDKLSALRTSKKIQTMEQATAPYYTVQIIALRFPPQDPAYFQNASEVKEYKCTDGYVRYAIGSYNTFAEANSALAQVRDLGFKDAFVANTKRYSMVESDYAQGGSKLNIVPNRDYVVQLGAFRYPVYLTFFENVDEVYEYRMNDKIFRYTTPPVKGTEVQNLLSEIKAKGYKNAFIVDYERYSSYKIE